MARFAKETTINASPEAVFQYVSNLPKHSEWASHELQITKASEGEVGMGSTYTSVGHQMGSQNDSLVVTDYVPGQRFAFEATGKAGVLRHAFEISPGESGSQVTKSIETVSLALMTRLMFPLLALAGPKGLEKDLARIKERLEA